MAGPEQGGQQGADQQSQQEALKQEVEAKQMELQQLLESFQKAGSPKEKADLARRIMAVLDFFRKIVPPEEFASGQLGQIEQMVNDQMGQLEG